jgi:hypothetical protein
LVVIDAAEWTDLVGQPMTGAILHIFKRLWVWV